MDKLLKTNYFLIQSQIFALKQKISSSDYKVVKATECATLGIECKYDLSALHAERQTIRDQINQLKQQISNLEKEYRIHKSTDL